MFRLKLEVIDSLSIALSYLDMLCELGRYSGGSFASHNRLSYSLGLADFDSEFDLSAK